MAKVTSFGTSAKTILVSTYYNIIFHVIESLLQDTVLPTIAVESIKDLGLATMAN